MSEYIVEKQHPAYLDITVEGLLQLTANGSILTFEDKASLEEYLGDQKTIDIWDIQDRCTPGELQTYYYRKNIDGDIKKYKTKQSLYKEISRDTNGAWELQTVQDESKKPAVSFVLDNSGWFKSDFQEFDSRDAFLTAIDAKKANQSFIKRLFWGVMAGAVVLGGGYAAYRYMNSESNDTSEGDHNGIVPKDAFTQRILLETVNTDPTPFGLRSADIRESESHLDVRNVGFEKYMITINSNNIHHTQVTSDDSLLITSDNGAIIKLDNRGEIVFAKYISNASGVPAVTPAKDNGEIFVHGNATSNSAFILKLDSAGNLLPGWGKIYTPPNNKLSIDTIREDDNGDLYVKGKRLFDYRWSCIMKLSANGTVEWSSEFGISSYQVVHSLVIDGDEIVAGAKHSITGNPALILSINKTTGNLIQDSQYGTGGNYLVASKMIKLTSDEYFMVGYHNTVTTYNSNARLSIMKVNKHASSTVFKTYGSQMGRFNTVIEIGNGAILASGDYNGDTIYMKMLSDGSVLWSNVVGGNAREALYLAEDSVGAIYVAAYFNIPRQGFVIKTDSNDNMDQFCIYTGNSNQELAASTTLADVAPSSVPITNVSNPWYRPVSIVTSSFTPSITDSSTISFEYDCSQIAPFLLSSSNSSDVNYTENQSPLAIDSGITISDPDSQLSSAEVTIANVVSAEDRLNFIDQSGVAGVYYSGTGVLSLTGVANVTDYQLALRNVTYENLSENPSEINRTITIKVNDGSSDSNILTRRITVREVNDAPVLAGNFGSATFIENTPIVIEPGNSVG